MFEISLTAEDAGLIAQERFAHTAVVTPIRVEHSVLLGAVGEGLSYDD